MAKCNFKLRLPSIRICRSKKPSSLPKSPSKLPSPAPAIFIPVIPKMLLSAQPSTKPALPKLCNSPVSEDLEEIPRPAICFSSADGGRSDQDEELISSFSSFDSSSDFGYAPKTINEVHAYGSKRKEKGMAKRQLAMSTVAEDKAAAAGMKVKMNESYAVTKKSEDPHDDFKTSMMEMIEEKDLSESEELEDLLMCFLSLNAKDHHAVILEAFSEVWDELFSTLYFPSSRLISSLSKE